MSAQILVLLALLLAPAPAAATILDFTGTCTVGCVGQATFHLETTVVIPPDTPTFLRASVDHDILVARYTDSEVSIDFAPQWPVLWVTWSSAPGGLVGLNAEVQSLTTDATGHWRFSGELPLRPDCIAPSQQWCGELAEGINAIWTDPPATVIPWDATWILILLGAASALLGRWLGMLGR